MTKQLVRVCFENPMYNYATMTNGSPQEILGYFVGSDLNMPHPLGDSIADNLQRVTHVYSISPSTPDYGTIAWYCLEVGLKCKRYGTINEFIDRDGRVILKYNKNIEPCYPTESLKLNRNALCAARMYYANRINAGV